MHSNANIDYCGAVVLLRALRNAGRITDIELRKIAARIAVQLGADIIISL